MAEVTGNLAKIWLLFTRNRSFSRLSLNIVREICLYLDQRPFLCYVYNFTLRIYDVMSSKFTESSLAESFNSEWMHCVVEDKFILGVCNTKVTCINIETQVISAKGHLTESRRWPGLIWVQPCIYVFGGNTSPALKSCEKLLWTTDSWTALQDMNTPRSCFTPCRVHNELFLCFVYREQAPFEAFNLLTETYRPLPVTYRSESYGVVTFLARNSLYILSYEDVLLRWTLNKSTLEPIRSLNLKENKDLGSSNIAPVCAGNRACWVCYLNGKVVTFDLEAGTVTTESVWTASH